MEMSPFVLSLWATFLHLTRKLFTLLLFCFFGSALASGVDDGVNAFKAARYAEAWAILTPLAQQGDAEAQRLVGEMAYNGQGVRPDKSAAFKWMSLAAEAGNKIAQFNLGYLYERGDGVSASNESAQRWYTKAANQGYVPAQVKLGDLNQEQNPGLASNWYNQARIAGDPYATAQYIRLTERESAANLKEWENQQKRLEAEREARASQLAVERAQAQAKEAADRRSLAEYNSSLMEQIQRRGDQDAALLRMLSPQPRPIQRYGTADEDRPSTDTATSAESGTSAGTAGAGRSSNADRSAASKASSSSSAVSGGRGAAGGVSGSSSNTSSANISGAAASSATSSGTSAVKPPSNVVSPTLTLQRVDDSKWREQQAQAARDQEAREIEFKRQSETAKAALEKQEAERRAKAQADYKPCPKGAYCTRVQ